ncbi:hypothetical protein BDV38DRAFT_52543 [Aspergillus pseudotamarii]|uniref:Uncharacterized protein n=1 Tax=Aspergillus pseudotamarii TaxID=132259 RepID=A0A5N6SAJ6_ASPPS|nr:uncharacterized protein BDV38DRAFT_52543 [Aspergillus pseudotamarii]KAE8130700.1 hypothetical protein BDV38DRAFT_52543 [Aspergillus pseudotamarii]
MYGKKMADCAISRASLSLVQQAHGVIVQLMERCLSGILCTRDDIWQLRAKVLRAKRSSSLKLGMEPKYGYGSCKVRRLPISEQCGDHSRRGLERSAWVVHAASQLRFRLPRVETRKSSPSVASWAASSTPHMRGHNAEDEAIRDLHRGAEP